MKTVDYLSIIQKYIPITSITYRIYITHTILVTAKALNIGSKLKLTAKQFQFIEEASMLHDIGIIRTKSASLGCNGDLPYICHGVEGRRILEKERLKKHALVAERHIGVGISKKEITKNNLPLPHRDMKCMSVEERIIAWADLFYGKNPQNLWEEKSIGDIRKRIVKYGTRHLKIFEKWTKDFEG